MVGGAADWGKELDAAFPGSRFILTVRDDDRWWLAPDEVNIGYHVFPAYRGRGYATRAVRLMVEHLRTDTDWETATLLIHPDNTASLIVAERNGFERAEDVEERTFWRRKVREAS